MNKVIHEATSTRVPVSLVKKVREAYEARKPNEPKLRMIDIWHELEEKVKSK